MTEDEFKKKLNPEQYRVMRQKDTERPFSGKYWDNDENGVYACTACNTVLFTSLAKFDAETGWPTFSGGIDKKYFEFKDGGEILCKKCQCHLGYLVAEEKGDKDRQYYRINSAALHFEPIEVEIEEDEGSEDSGQSAVQSSAPTVALSAGSPLLQMTALAAAGIIGGGILGNWYGVSQCTPSEALSNSATSSPSAPSTINANTSATFVAPKPTTPTPSNPVKPGTAASAPAETPASAGTPSGATPATSSSAASDGTI